MRISHIAIWTDRLEELKDFYATYFSGVIGQKHVNLSKGFESYFVSFDNDIAIELMSRKDINQKADKELLGYCHIAFAMKNKDDVFSMTELLRTNGYQVIGEPRTTSDGMFESVVMDPDSNRIELCCD